MWEPFTFEPQTQVRLTFENESGKLNYLSLYKGAIRGTTELFKRTVHRVIF